MKKENWRALRELPIKFPTSQQQGLSGLLFFVGAISGAKDLFVGVPPDVSIYIILAVGLLIVLAQSRRAFKVGQVPPLPEKPEKFLPFRTSDSEAPLWPRQQECEDLERAVRQAATTHVVIAGPSGAGKSSLVTRLLSRRFKIEFGIFRAYDQFFVDFFHGFKLSGRALQKRHTILADYKKFVDDHRRPVREVLTSDFEDESADQMWRRIRDFLSDVLESTEDEPKVFVFDQIERLIGYASARISHGESEVNGLDIWLFLKLISFLRADPRIRTVFIIRAEYLYQSFEFLEKLSAGSQRDPSPIVHHILCPGINTLTSPDAMHELQEVFCSVHNNGRDYDQFEKMNGLRSRTFANTFMAQLTGFMIEHYWEADPRIPALLRSCAGREAWLHLFFEYVLNDYDRQYNSKGAVDILRATLFTIAIENRVAGRAIGIEDIASLAHVPPLDVRQAVLFLRQGVGILEEEARDGDFAYRIVHDILADYVIENEQFTIDAGLKEAIRGLSEASVSPDKLTKVKAFASPVWDIMRGDPTSKIVNAFLWSFFVYGAARIVSIRVCEKSSDLLASVWLSQDCASTQAYYIPTYCFHVVWVSYIYIIDRDYLRHVLRDRWLKVVSASMAPIGAVLGFVFSASPILYLVPVCAIGLIFGLLLIISSSFGQFTGRARDENMRWGWRTFLNMALTLLLIPITASVLWSAPEAENFWRETILVLLSPEAASSPDALSGVRTGWFLFQGMLMVYFWLHIRPEHLQHISTAARLALYDRTQLMRDHATAQEQ